MYTQRHEYVTSQAEAGLPAGKLHDMVRRDGALINWFAMGILIGIFAFSAVVKAGLLPVMIP